VVKLEINGASYRVRVMPDTPLLWVLRDVLGLTGTKFGCGRGLCGACSVLLDNQSVRSCITPISAVKGRSVTTIEGMAADAVGRQVQQAWIEEDVVQCGYCQSGQIVSAVALLKLNRHPDDKDIDGAMAGNICRCGTYCRIRSAIGRASKKL